MTPDTFKSVSVNAAVCPTAEEQEKRAAPRWQRPIPPKEGRSLEGGSHQAEQMREAAPDGGGGSRGAAGHVALAREADEQRRSSSMSGPPAPAAF